jgi:hypothetical protein
VGGRRRRLDPPANGRFDEGTGPSRHREPAEPEPGTPRRRRYLDEPGTGAGRPDRDPLDAGRAARNGADHAGTGRQGPDGFGGTGSRRDRDLLDADAGRAAWNAEDHAGTGRRNRDEPAVGSLDPLRPDAPVGRRRLREPVRDGVPTEPWPLEPDWRRDEPVGADRTLASEGWRRERVADTTGSSEWPSELGSRRPLGAEYLLDDGGRRGRRHGSDDADAPLRSGPPPWHPSDPPTEPLMLPRPTAGDAARPARRSRHATSDEGEMPPASIPVNKLLGDLARERPSGRHRRRAD